jgi:hypothetical protein
VSVTGGVVLYGPDGRTLVGAANPLAVVPISGGGAVGVGNPLLVSEIVTQATAATGTAAAPGAGSAVATLTPAAGTYRVTLIYQLSGTAEAAAKNLRLSGTGTSFSTDFPTSGAGTVVVVIDAVTMDGVGNLRATAIAAATAGSVYTVTIIAARRF